MTGHIHKITKMNKVYLAQFNYKNITFKKKVIFVEIITIKRYNEIEAKGFNYFYGLIVILLTNS